MSKAQEPDDLHDPKWIVFADTGKAACVAAWNMGKAVAQWKKTHGRGGGEPIGCIRVGYSSTVPFSYQNTDVFGVVCCVHTPPKPGQKGPHS